MKNLTLIAGILSTFVASVLAQNTDLWSSVFFHDGIVESKNIELMMVSQEPFHLMGDLVLSAAESPKGSDNVFSVPIHQGPDRSLEPNMAFEVSQTGNANWTIIKSTLEEPVLAALIIKPGGNGISVRVVLDPFQKSVGQYKFGRIRFKGGESTVFPLSWLTKQG